MQQLLFNVKNPYRIINVIFLSVILIIFLYSAIFSSEKNNYPVKSNYTLLTGKTTLSSGLSHGFSSIVRGQIDKANKFNPYSIRIFTFFVVQLLMRIFVLLYINKDDENKQTLAAKIDGLISSGLFILFFYPFLEDLFR